MKQPASAMTRFLHLTSLFIVTSASVVLAAEGGSYRNLDARECPLLDTPYRTRSAFELAVAFPAETDAAGWGDRLSVINLSLWTRLINWENSIGSELEAAVHWDTMILEGFPKEGNGDSIYALTMPRLFLQWSQRYQHGYGMQLYAMPGFYSAMTDAQHLSGDGFSIPAGLVIIKAFSPDFAVFAGVDVYPDFDQSVEPRLGCLYALRDQVMLQLAYPESRLELSPAPVFRFLLGIQMQQWQEYSLGRKDLRERIQYDETRAYAGIEVGITPRKRLVLQGGYLFGRDVEFETESKGVSLDDTPFAMLGIRGKF